MNTQIIDLILIFAVLGIVFFLLFKIIQLVNERPDITALLSVVAMFVGYGLLVVGSNPTHGLTAFVCGVVGLFVSALNHSRAKRVKS